jgi:hypothetical protein
MTRTQFLAIPLLRSFIAVDPNDGAMVYTQVRRDPATGLTLKLSTKTPNQ